MSFYCQGQHTIDEDMNEPGIEQQEVSTVQRNENIFQLKNLYKIKNLNWNRNEPNLKCNKTYEYRICTLSIFASIY